MPVTINRDGSITGLSVGGLPNGSVNADTIAANAVTDAKISAMAASKLTGIAGAVGGANTNPVFYENDNSVDVSYTITSGKNAMAAGPIAIKSGVTVTVPSGSFLTIV